MRINSLYISAFGKIKDLKLDFTDGFNIVYGDNENGKSTIMAFIKMMFYGSDRSSSKLSKNIRKKYTPWDNSNMAGSIDFTHSGRNYRLEREFRSSNSTDKATLCDLDFGTRQAVGADIGTKFFGLSSAAFERSVFIGQFGFPENDSEAEGEINSKLSNMVLTGDESISFETVNSRLEKAKLSLMSKSGKAGEYDKNVIRHNALSEKIDSLKDLSADVERKKGEIDKVQEKIELMEQKAKELKKQISAENDLRNAEKLKEFLSLKAKLDETNRELALSDGSLADEMYLSKLKFCVTKVQNAKQATEAKQGEINTINKSLEVGLNPPEDATEENAQKIESEIERLTEEKTVCYQNAKKAENDLKILRNKKSGSALWILLLLGTVLFGALTGILAFISDSNVLPIISAGLAAVLLCCFVAVLATDSKKKKEKELLSEKLEANREKLYARTEELDNVIFTKKVTLEAINTALNSSAVVISRQKELLQEAEEQLLTLKTEENEALKVLIGAISVYKQAESFEEILSLMEDLSEKSLKQKEIKQQLNFISRNIGSISYEEASEKLNEISNLKTDSNVDFDKLKSDYEELLNDITEHKSAVAAAKVSVKSQSNALEELPSLQREVEILEEKIAEQKDFCKGIDIALSSLRESFAEVRRSYGSVLEKKAGEIFANLTDGKYESMSISKSFDINVESRDVFGGKEIDYLSSGTADQAYLSLRLALSQLMCEGKELLPVMLDDALAQYDDVRMAKAVDYLKNYGKDSQIIMFTCHNAVSKEAIGKGANSIIL